MKRIVSVLLAGLLVISSLTACGKEEKEAVIQLDLNKLVLEDGTYGWDGLALNSSVKEVEEKLDLDLGEPLSEDGEFAGYIAKRGKTPVVIEYKEHRGHMRFSFQNGELAGLYMEFRAEAPEYADYGGVVNDIDSIYNMLSAELEEVLGPHRYESEDIHGDPGFRPAYGWQVFQDIGDGFQTRLDLAAHVDEEDSSNSIIYIAVERMGTTYADDDSDQESNDNADQEIVDSATQESADNPAQETAKDSRSAERDLNLENILLDNGGYGWKEVAYGSSIDEAEKALNVNFPEIPDMCNEWLDGTLPYNPEAIQDYRNSTDFDYVCYTAYIGEEPLILNYGEHRGHMLLDFYPDGLYAIYLRFGVTGTVRDPLMNYGGEPNNLEGVYNQLYTDLTTLIGEPTHTFDNKVYESTTYAWVIEMEDGYKNRIQLDIDMTDEEKGITQLSIYRIAPQ